MSTRRRVFVEKDSLFGWIYYVDDPAQEKYPATSEPRAVDAAIEFAKARIDLGEDAEVHVSDAAGGWRLAWPVPVAQLHPQPRKRVSGRAR
jgi:hypothetical protein